MRAGRGDAGDLRLVIPRRLRAEHAVVRRVLFEDAVRLAVLVAAEARARGVWRVARDARELERARVADAGVTVGAHHVDRLRGRDEVEVCGGRRAPLGELRLVVAPAFDPLVRPPAEVAVTFKRLDHPRDVVDERDGAGHGAYGHRHVGRVRMNVYEARHDGSASEVNGARGVHLARVAGPDEPPALDVERADELDLAARREHLAVDESLSLAHRIDSRPRRAACITRNVAGGQIIFFQIRVDTYV